MRDISTLIPLLGLLVSCTTSSVAPPVKPTDASAPYDAGDLDGLTDDQLCQRQCAAFAEVNCPDQANCLSVCTQDFATMPCTEEMRAAITCVVQKGPSILTCDPLQHVTIVQPGNCTAEQAAVIACIRDAGTGG